jgi:hypothetical protein
VVAADLAGTEAGEFVERFADAWSLGGGSRTEGRIAAYLLLDESDGVTAEQLATALAVSRGSVSTCTRRLVGAGFVRRVRRRGDRADYFVMDLDVWGGFLDQQHAYLVSQRDLAARTLPLVAPGTPAATRLRNMRDYMGWLLDGLQVRGEWERYKRERDAR